MYESVKTLFDAVAGEYDRQRRQLIPCFDDFYGMALSLVETGQPAPRILDLGAGTGLFSGMVLHKYPNARLTLMDMSDSMLEGARQRFAGRDNIRYIVGDYSDYPFDETYDIVISSLSIHHLTHPAKRQLFAAIYPLLNAGGLFVNADQVEGHHPQTDRYYRQRWLSSIHESGLAQEAIDASIERRKLDINAKASDQIAWMEQAGFDEVDCMYKYLDFAVFYGKKG
ncbi:2-methoxy-6-polyprenyl-1,4-benzoquinol methylase, mitochondrial [Paenibacillus solanacearum]|uniref:2-methoxy-6-polyprenyl-1,4-benzoquinol methylase, mitochondrial n=1 Tax=Paenibacillus solanacearum TaxID=2048548 RepID=A0A916NJD2_9BACL|nr:class I SAM-dependent methyltransferase [Paenibacillus solanacearum]CAG7633135.1 2-methoxy-6-polyprenyl-1,4-benzoquinol methylase, mitochondrial [Paenibacillus solanacearum]